MPSETRYARSGDLNIAYQAAGAGPDVIYVPTFVNQIEILMEEPSLKAFIERMCGFSRLISFDRRGTGLSDPTPGVATIEEQMDDVLAVMDAVGSQRAALMGSLEGGCMAITFAATHPERVSSLILYASFASVRRDEELTWTMDDATRAQTTARVVEQWGHGASALALAPSRAADPAFQRWAGRMERYAFGPGRAAEVFDAIGQTDVRDVLPTLCVPTLVMHRRDDAFCDVRHGRYLGEHIPRARYVELEGADSLFTVGDAEAVLGEIEEQLTGERHVPEPDRVLATVLFTDVVGSTRRAAELGDARWRELLVSHDSVVRAEVARHRGALVKSTGDGVLATFDGPARAVRAAQAIGEGVRGLGLEIRAGLHTGECEVVGDDVAGLAVHIGARVMAKADPGEVLVSSTVRDLVAGSQIDFAERGSHELRDVPGRWNLFRARVEGPLP